MTLGPVAENTRKILVVDDDRELCQNIQDIFHSVGYDVICAFDGYQAIERVKKDAPHIILMDIQMPLMDGITALREIRQLTPTARVLIMTGSASRDLVAWATHEGAAAVFHKPLDYQLLVQTIDEENRT